MKNEFPSIAKVVPAEGQSITVYWKNGGSATVDLAGWIAGGSDILAPLNDPEVFKSPRVTDFDGAVEWGEIGGDLAIDAHHLQLMAETQAFLDQVQVGDEGFLPHDIVMRMGKENRVKVLREYRQMTQKELAEKTGLSSVNISQIETNLDAGEWNGLQKIATALGVPLGVILLNDLG